MTTAWLSSRGQTTVASVRTAGCGSSPAAGSAERTATSSPAISPSSRGARYPSHANHYPQVDRPDAFVKVLLHALEPADGQGPGPLTAELGALLVDSSRERLPAAADVLREAAPADAN